MSLSVAPAILIRNDIAALIYAVAVGGLVYVASLLLTRAVDKKELAMLPLGNILSKILGKLGYFKERTNYDNGSGVGMQ